MKIRPLVSTVFAGTAAALLLGLYPLIHGFAPRPFRAEDAQRCAHTIVFAALILEAVAIWLNARSEEKAALFRVVASMFAFSGVLGLASLFLESAAMILPIA